MGRRKSELSTAANNTSQPTATTKNTEAVSIAQKIIDAKSRINDDEVAIHDAVLSIKDMSMFKAVQAQLFAKTNKGLAQYLSEFMDTSDNIILQQIEDHLTRVVGLDATSPTLRLLQAIHKQPATKLTGSDDSGIISPITAFIYGNIALSILAAGGIGAFLLGMFGKRAGGIKKLFAGIAKRFRKTDIDSIANDPSTINLLNQKLGYFELQSKYIQKFLQHQVKKNVMTREQANKLLAQVLNDPQWARKFRDEMSTLVTIAYKDGKINKKTARSWLIDEDWPDALKKAWDDELDRLEQKLKVRTVMGKTKTAATSGTTNKPNYNYTYTTSTGSTGGSTTIKPKPTKTKPTTPKPSWSYPNVTPDEYKTLSINQQARLKANPNLTLAQLKKY